MIITLLGACGAYSQKKRSEIFVDFKVNSVQIDPGYMDNAARISELNSLLHEMKTDSTIHIAKVSFCGVASPEGSDQQNRTLAKGRMESLEKWIRGKVEIPDSIITYNDSYIPWEYFATLIEGSDVDHKDEVLKIINGESAIVDYAGGGNIDSRILRLKALDNGNVWQEMNKYYFNRMRSASVVFITFKKEVQPAVTPIVEEQDAVCTTDTVSPVVTPVPQDSAVVPRPAPVTDEWQRRLTVKTNALGWGLAIANAAVEIDLCRHWSFNLPVYYSAWDYFTSSIKFCTLAVQPEIRYWFSDKNDAWFTGVHFGLAYYNIDTDGKYRIQDHDGKSPALGGGVAVGYRMPISKNRRWKMEFSIGAGVYRLHHDKFYNYSYGPLAYTEKKTYIGIDQASVSFSYTFDLKRKGGAR